MARLALIIAIALVARLGFAQTPELVQSGKLTWGDSVTFPPFEFEENAKPVGFDVDLVDALAKQMGLQPAIMQISFSGLIPALLGKRIDIIVSGMYINPQRLQVADMIPYLVVGDQIVVRNGNPKHINSEASLCGLNVAVPVGTVYEASAKRVSSDCQAARKPAINLLALPGTTNCALALTQGRADAIIVSNATVAALMYQEPNTYGTGGPPFDTNTKVGIAVRKDTPALKAALEKALQAIVADGTYAALIKEWNLPASSSIF